MKRFMMFGAALTMGLTFIAGPAVAQMSSIPVMFNPKGGTGLLVALDVGKGMNTESGKNTALAFRSALGIGPVTIGGGIGIVNPDQGGTVGRKSQTQYMGNFALRVFGGGLLPVSISLQGGVGVLNVVDLGQKVITVPVGLGLSTDRTALVGVDDPDTPADGQRPDAERAAERQSGVLTGLVVCSPANVERHQQARATFGIEHHRDAVHLGRSRTGDERQAHNESRTKRHKAFH